MAKTTKKLSTKSVKPVTPLSDADIDDFLCQLYEARELRDDLVRANHGGIPTQIVARAAALNTARTNLAPLEDRYLVLRGDFDVVASPSTPQTRMPSNWRMRIQAEAWEHWLRLRATGCNPSVHSISEDLARWCITHDVRGGTNQNPRAGTIRNTVLGASHWTPPQHSVEKAKEYIAQIAQVAQLNPPTDEI